MKIYMSKENSYLLRQRFLNYIDKKLKMNNHSLKDISCVYTLIEIDIYSKRRDIVYVGSTTKLFSRYKSHKVPEKIQKSGKLNLMYFIPMNKGFYDYEIKLIKNLQPKYNKQHK